MRLPAWEIKQAILLPDEELRVVAAAFFARRFSPDRTVMPIVINAVRRYGQRQSARLLREARFLAQTERTIEWLLAELAPPGDPLDLVERNYRFAAALTLLRAPLHLVSRRETELARLRGFPEILRRPLEARLLLARADWEMGSAELVRFGERTLPQGTLSRYDRLMGDAIVESLTQHRETRENNVLVLLQRRSNNRVLEWLEPLIVQLAGWMRLASAVPVLIDRLASDGETLRDEAAEALVRIGSPETVDLLAKRWPQWGPEAKLSACEVFEGVPSDGTLPLCLRHLADSEEDPLVRMFLAHAALGQFDADALEPIRDTFFTHRRLRGADHSDLYYRQIAMARILGADYPLLKARLAQARRRNWGWEPEDLLELDYRKELWQEP